MNNKIGITRSEYDRLHKLQSSVDLIEELEEHLSKEDILIILGIKEAKADA
jgi:hypothetical protein